MRKVDKLGRIVIPRELRRKYGLDCGARVEFVDNGNGILVRSREPFCRVCGGRILADSVIPVCESCLGKIKKENR